MMIDGRYVRGYVAGAVERRSTSPSRVAGKQLSTRPSVSRHRQIFEDDHSHAGNVIRAARQRRGTTFLTDAAEAKWCHGILAKEWGLVQQRKNAGWWQNETVPVLMQIELQSRMNVLVQRYGREW